MKDKNHITRLIRCIYDTYTHTHTHICICANVHIHVHTYMHRNDVSLKVKRILARNEKPLRKVSEI